MAFQRRRHHFYQRFRLMIPMISTVAAALLFLFAMLSFLAPSPIESDPLHRRRHYTAVILLTLLAFTLSRIDYKSIAILCFSFSYVCNWCTV